MLGEQAQWLELEHGLHGLHDCNGFTTGNGAGSEAVTATEVGFETVTKTGAGSEAVKELFVGSGIFRGSDIHLDLDLGSCMNFYRHL